MSTPPIPPRPRRPEPEPRPGHPAWCDPAECKADEHRGALYVDQAMHRGRVTAQIYQPASGATPPRIRVVASCWGATLEWEFSPRQAMIRSVTLGALAEQAGS